jgi:hypothetical protein
MSLGHLLCRQTSAKAIGHADASGYTAPTAILAAPTRNLQITAKTNMLTRSEFHYENITKPIHEINQNFDWQTVRAANSECIKADSHIACRAHAVPLPCRAAKSLECVFPIWFTQCGRVWFIKMWSVNQTRPHCVNQMGKAHSKSLAARHGRGTAWARRAMCESALRGSDVRNTVSL